MRLRKHIIGALGAVSIVPTSIQAAPSAEEVLALNTRLAIELVRHTPT